MIYRTIGEKPRKQTMGECCMIGSLKANSANAAGDFLNARVIASVDIDLVSTARAARYAG